MPVISDDLLVNTSLEPGFPRKIGIETVMKWMHELRFSVMQKKEGSLVDGQEPYDVVKYRNTFCEGWYLLVFLSATTLQQTKH